MQRATVLRMWLTSIKARYLPMAGNRYRLWSSNEEKKALVLTEADDCSSPYVLSGFKLPSQSQNRHEIILSLVSP